MSSSPEGPRYVRLGKPVACTVDDGLSRLIYAINSIDPKTSLPEGSKNPQEPLLKPTAFVDTFPCKDMFVTGFHGPGQSVRHEGVKVEASVGRLILNAGTIPLSLAAQLRTQKIEEAQQLATAWVQSELDKSDYEWLPDPTTSQENDVRPPNFEA